MNETRETSLAERCESLQQLTADLANQVRLLQEQVALNAQRWGTSRDSGNILVVTMPDGFPIRQSSQAKTFVLTIEMLGTDRVKDLGKTSGTRDLISNHRVYSSCYPSGSYYIFTNMSIRRKKELLEEIARELDPPVDIHVEIFRRVSDADAESA